eukprot:1797270-Ditylum_brightwellii.AAC.1
MAVKDVHKFGLIVHCPDDIINAKAALKEAHSKVREIIRKAAETRKQHNKTMAQIHSLTGKKKAEQAFNAIMNAETMSNMWKKIGCAYKGHTENNITSISILDKWPDMSNSILAANSPMSEAVLQGKLTDTELPELQQLFLKHCKMAPIEKYVGEKSPVQCGKAK